MKRCMMVLFALAPALLAQTDGGKNALSGEIKQAYTNIKNNLIKAAESMPEENYDYKPSPDIRSFGALVAHIADANTFYCSAYKGAMKKPTASSKTTKADIVAALKAAFSDECDSVYDGLTDAAANEMVKVRSSEMTKMGVAIRNLGHDNEEYGYLAVYLRLKGIVPPSSAK